jgi:fructose-bisphosphate aldolase class 1
MVSQSELYPFEIGCWNGTRCRRWGTVIENNTNTPLLHRAKKAGIFGSKMRSVIEHANKRGNIRAIVEQEFSIGKQIIESGLITILEPEVDIHIAEKVQCEEILNNLQRY